MAVSAILFDLDGTLVDSERESAEAMARALSNEHDIEVSQAERDFIIGRSWVEIYRNIKAGHPELTWTREQLIAKTAAARVQVFEEVGITVLPGAVSAVERFADFQRGLVTGSSRVEAAQALGFLGIAESFDVLLFSEDVAHSKPHPAGYEAAAARLSVAPAHCLVVEDSTAGIAAGLAAGCRVVAIGAGNFHAQDQSAAHFQLATLHDLTREFVQSL